MEVNQGMNGLSLSGECRPPLSENQNQIGVLTVVFRFTVAKRKS